MTIKEIETLSGLPRANIRYYESEGLISPKRAENGYREYSQADVNVLLRDGLREQDVARTIRFLCKQGAPLSAMEEVLQASMIAYLSASARGALADMYYMLPKWMECSEGASFQ